MKTAAVEAAFACGGDRFSVVYDALLSGRSDKALKHLVLTLLDFSRTQPDPDGWLDGCLTLYDDPAAVDAALAALSAGTYWLKAELPAPGNYSALKTVVSFKVLQSRN